MKKDVYTINAEGVEFTIEEVRHFLYSADNIGNCEECPYNAGYEKGGAYTAGPCGQQNCWVVVHSE